MEPPRIPEDPEEFDVAVYTDRCCTACACWPSPDSVNACPRREPRPGEDRNSAHTFLCYGSNRPDGIRVMYVPRRLYGNEED